MAAGLSVAHDSICCVDHAILSDDVDSLDDADLSVSRTPKSMLIALLIAIIAGAIAYQQAPHEWDHRGHRTDRTEMMRPAAVSLDDLDPSEHWATADVAPMPLGMDG